MKFAILPTGGLTAVAAVNSMIPEIMGIKRKSTRIGSTSSNELNYRISGTCADCNTQTRYSKLKSFIFDSSMTLRNFAFLLLPALVTSPALRAQPVFHDSQAPQVSFASAQIARALGAKRATADHGLRDLNSFAGSLRFAIAGDAAESNALA